MYLESASCFVSVLEFFMNLRMFGIIGRAFNISTLSSQRNYLCVPRLKYVKSVSFLSPSDVVSAYSVIKNGGKMINTESLQRILHYLIETSEL